MKNEDNDVEPIAGLGIDRINATLARSNETAAIAVAEKARAEVQARFTVALHRPRDLDVVRQRMLKDAKRPMFAEVARYAKPIGGKPIEGPSIRFVESALRHMGNVSSASQITYEDDDKRIVHVSVTDLETNTTYGLDVTIAKTVERRQLRKGQTAIDTRTNSYGDTVYVVEATEDDLVVKQGALVSKALRTLGLRILPGDLVEEAQREVMSTLRNTDKQDPDAARKRIIDSFFGVNVDADQLKKYLGHAIEQSTPAELQALRQIYQALRDGETTWADVMDSREEQRDAKGKTKGQNLRDKVKSEAEKAKGPIDYLRAAHDADSFLATVKANAAWIAANGDASWPVISERCTELKIDPDEVSLIVSEAVKS